MPASTAYSTVPTPMTYVKPRDEVAFYSGRRRHPTFRRVSSILGATRSDPIITLIFTDGTRLKGAPDMDVDVRAKDRGTTGMEAFFS